MNDAPVAIFVYGTLMRGYSRHHLMSNGRFEREASAQGRLISLGEYPALIDGSGVVRGELYTFDDLPVALDVLDDVEDFDPANPERGEYVREMRRVSRDDGSESLTWIYVYNRPAGDAPIIPSGDWRHQLGRP
jgi:gamma-glutamylcyclotransferase (GGCT)/AIG2-like uncharacterized protein YtfP